MKVWLVYMDYREDRRDDVVKWKSVCKVFDSEEKAVNYIRERINLDHEYMEHRELNFDRQNYVRFELDQQKIIEGHTIGSYRYYDETVGYYYIYHEVE